jgi:hypothetical protein
MFDTKSAEKFRVGVGALSDVIAAAKAKDSFPKKYQTFVAACQTQTDNIKPRQIRLQTLMAATE